MYRAPCEKLMNSSSPKIRFRPSASSTSSAPLTRPSSSWETSWSMRPPPPVGVLRTGRRGAGRSARALELGPDLVAGRGELLGARGGGDHLAVAELGVAAAALRLVGGQPLEDVDGDERLVVARADRHVALAEGDLQALHPLAERLGGVVALLDHLREEVDGVVGVDAVAARRAAVSLPVGVDVLLHALVVDVPVEGGHRPRAVDQVEAELLVEAEVLEGEEGAEPVGEPELRRLAQEADLVAADAAEHEDLGAGALDRRHVGVEVGGAEREERGAGDGAARLLGDRRLVPDLLLVAERVVGQQQEDALPELAADEWGGGVRRLGGHRCQVVGELLVEVRRPVELLGLAGPEVGDAGLRGDLVHRQRRGHRDAAGEEVDLLLLHERLRLAEGDVGLELVVADDELDGAVTDPAPELLDGQLGTAALLLAQLHVGAGEAGDDADPDRLGGPAAPAATATTTTDGPAARGHPERHSRP